MPEIPEMEVYKKQLSETVVHKKIVDITINREKSINVEPQLFKDLVNDQLIIFVSRRAKHLIFTLGNGYYLVTHLMLGGRIYLAQPGEKVNTRGSVIFHFFDKTKLYFINLRLGWLYVLTENEMDELFAKLGPEPLGKYFTLEWLSDSLSQRRGALKPLLTDQAFIAGIGNCYSDEILFRAGIRPDRKANELNLHEVTALFSAIPSTLQDAINNGGYMEKLFNSNDHFTGKYNDYLKVYDREGQPCYQCNDTVQLITVSGKKSFFCPSCQN
ncbi:MAG: formamidopyrimidine-DNA glycosylase [Clostridia bacterium]|nr:formamidopyrimidine-DNA glycosylase [Clostridia bacterium]MDN5321853.1 formamidopyrimidine-DNA glycosylase [Clostridia bacterium]